ncbi:hypothetical protein [Pseudomonas sp. DP-17]|uniref:hypothetical protein n=1 Tax=Pseudomonas sp. DP-17 TaxID=1580486 RepID=UPI001EFBF7C6|nr:hypothetical protein [Pseudomonas sp. DP-17]MCG8909301.1 hypothetical protein [Pseudomonas sp. DP-17]
MADFDLATAIALIGKFALVETIHGEGTASGWYCVHILGVAPPSEGVFAHPFFLVRDIPFGSDLPEELFWEEIRSLQVLDSEEVQAWKKHVVPSGEST